MKKRAAIYCRISDDRTGEAAGTTRQEDDCRALAERKGWEVVGIYTDNDISAFTGKVRPSYRRLLGDIEAGLIDAVIVWHADRLHRQPRELEAFIDLSESRHIALATVTGDMDLATPAGRLHARTFGNFGVYESEQKGERIRRKHLEIAAAGRNSGGGSRPFGFEQDRVTVRASEAKLIREAAKAVMSGASIRSIAADWNRRRIRSSAGKPWRATSLHRLLTSARIGGWREHHGKLVAKAEWKAIITPQQSDQLRTFLRDPARRLNAGVRRYLLTGFAACGLCGKRLHARPRADKARCYVCASGPGFDGCGKIRVLADPLEELVSGMAIAALDTVDLARALDRQRQRLTGAKGKAGDLDAAEADLEALASDFGSGRIGRREWLAAREPLEARIATLRVHAVAGRDAAVLRPYVGKPGALARAWPQLDIDKQRIVIGAAVTSVTVGPAVRGRNRFDPDRVDVVWRF